MLGNRIFSLHSILFAFCASLCLFVPNTATPSVVIDPQGIFAHLNEDNEEQLVEVIITNEDEMDYAFQVSLDLPEEEGDLRRGPRRDDPGDILGNINVGNGAWTGITWDGDLLWGIEWEQDIMIAWDYREEDIVEEINLGMNIFGLTFNGEDFWGGRFNENGQASLVRFNREGELLQNMNIQGLIATGIAWDGENLWCLVIDPNGRPGILRQVTENGEQLQEINLGELLGDQQIAAIAWVPEHEAGHLWTLVTDGQLYQLTLQEDNFEIIAEARVNRQNLFGLDHDAENLLCGGQGNSWSVIDDGIQEPRWLEVEPMEGVIQADDELTLDFLFTPDIEEAGVYEMTVNIDFYEDEEGGDLIYSKHFSAVMSLDSPVGVIEGVVVDRESGEPINNAGVDLQSFDAVRFTNRNGVFEFENLPSEVYELFVTAEHYLPQAVEVEVADGDVAEPEIEMLHAECNIENENIEIDLAPDEFAEENFLAANNGNGTLIYRTEKRIDINQRIDPWDLIFSLNAGELLDDSRLQGSVYLDGNYYIAGANDRDPVIYVVSPDGELIRQFDQPGDSRYGMRDLAWDGELIWGSGEETVFGVTLEGEVETEFEGPFNPNNNIAWDPDREIFWIASTTSDIAGVDREGNVVDELSRMGLRNYGLSYYPDDPDGYNLYIFAKMNDIGDLLIYKMNPQNNDTIFVANLDEFAEGNPIGSFITNEHNPLIWSFVAAINDGQNDRIDVFELGVRTNWVEIEPQEGEIPAGDNEEFTISFDASNLEPDVYELDIVFIHNGFGGETVLSATMNVIEGPVIAERILDLSVGWNMVSVNVQPEDNDIRAVTEPIVDQDRLILMKDGLGRFYNPEFDFNNIPGWDVHQGYLMKLRDQSQLAIEGMTVMADAPIELRAGWNMTAYFPREPVEATVALSGIEENLILAKDGEGRFYNPEWDFSNMGDMREGRGYQLKVSDDVELIYNVRERGLADNPEEYPNSGLVEFQPTGANMSLLILAKDLESEEIAVYSSDKLAGTSKIHDGKCGIAVWGDDPTTPSIDGALQDEPLIIRLLNGHADKHIKYRTLQGKPQYEADGLWVVRIESQQLPEKFGILSAFPNPFNNQTTITFSLIETARIDLGLYDTAGRLVRKLAQKKCEKGVHRIVINKNELSTGIYFVRLESGDSSSSLKILMVK